MAADTFLTHDMLAERALFDLQNELTISRHVYKGYSDEYHSVGGFKKGDTVRIQLPNKFRTKAGAALDVVGVQERNTTVVVDNHRHVDWDFLETDMTLKIENMSKKYLKPAGIALANIVDAHGAAEYVNIYNLVGTPGTTPNTFGVLADGAERMDNEAIPRDRRVSVLSPRAHWAMADGELKGVFQQQIVDTLLRKGFIGNFALFDFFMDQNIANHTVGDHGGAPAMDGATLEGATQIVTKGWGLSDAILNQGDIITIAAVAGVNPVSGQVWENAQSRQFVVTENATSDGAGDATIQISPTIYSAAATEDYLPYQTVDVVPLNNAVITVVGTANTVYPQNLMFHPDCFALTMVPFVRPRSAGQSVMWGSAADPQLGIAITVCTAFDINTYLEVTREDILYGWDTIQPEYGVRLTG